MPKKTKYFSASFSTAHLFLLVGPHSQAHVSFCTERGDVDERFRGLADPRHPQRHQCADPQGEEPDSGAVYERGTGQEAFTQETEQPEPPAAALPAPLADPDQQPLVPAQTGQRHFHPHQSVPSLSLSQTFYQCLPAAAGWRAGWRRLL